MCDQVAKKKKKLKFWSIIMGFSLSSCEKLVNDRLHPLKFNTYVKTPPSK